MPINHEEIIEEIEGHIRKFGVGFSEWCVGTAKDSRGPFFRRHLAADLGDGLIYREAFTTSAADQAVDHMVNACGLRPDRDSVPAAGKSCSSTVKHGTRDTGLGKRYQVSGARCQDQSQGRGYGIQAKWEMPRPPPAAIRPCCTSWQRKGEQRSP